MYLHKSFFTKGFILVRAKNNSERVELMQNNLQEIIEEIAKNIEASESQSSDQARMTNFHEKLPKPKSQKNKAEDFFTE